MIPNSTIEAYLKVASGSVRWRTQIAFIHYSSTSSYKTVLAASLEILDFAFVLLSLFARIECAEVSAFAGFGVHLAGI